MAWHGLIHAYRKFLPVRSDQHIVTLLEGNTPLVPAETLAKALGLPGRLFLKVEGQNPTGSFKDRGMTYAMSKALAQGAKAVICASTGNTAASAAAYAARAGITCLVVVPAGMVALGKLSQAAIHGARILKVRGNFDAALRVVREASEQFPMTLVNSLNPFRIEGQRTAAFEICETLGEAPDFHALPVGNAGNIVAYWKGYREYHELGFAKRLPRMLGFQAKGAAPIVEGRPFPNPETVATAIRVGDPASWSSAEAVRDQSGGMIEAVTDEEITEAYEMLAKMEGVFCEPASAAAVAGVKRFAGEGLFQKGSTVVCTLTGHGLKDPEFAMSRDLWQKEVEARLEDIVEAAELK